MKDDIKCILLNQSSTELDLVPDNSVDLILTDPPYYDNLSYSELSDFFYVWIRNYMPKDGNGQHHSSTPYQEALFANNNVTDNKFITDLAAILKHCKRSLKSNGLMIFTFHHRKIQAWISLAKALSIVGFQITNVFPVRSEGISGFHSTEGTIKWDSVITCRPSEKTMKDSEPKFDLNQIISKFNYWKERLNIAKLEFRCIDEISLSCALSMQYILEITNDPNQIEKLMLKANDEFINLLI